MIIDGSGWWKRDKNRGFDLFVYLCLCTGFYLGLSVLVEFVFFKYKLVAALAWVYEVVGYFA